MCVFVSLCKFIREHRCSHPTEFRSFPLTSFTCCLSRWNICPELVAAISSYTRYPGWLLSPQSPVSTNTTYQRKMHDSEQSQKRLFTLGRCQPSPHLSHRQQVSTCQLQCELLLRECSTSVYMSGASPQRTYRLMELNNTWHRS